MRRSPTKHERLSDTYSSSKDTEKFNFNEFKNFYKPALENLFGCCLEEILQTVEQCNKDEQEQFSNICTIIFENKPISSIETQKILDIIKQNYNIIFSQIDSSHSISHLVYSNNDFEAYKSSMQKLPRLLFIFRELKNVSSDTTVTSTHLELLKLIVNHLILPEPTKERIRGLKQNIGDILNLLYLDTELPSSKLLDILFCGHLPGQRDNFTNFKHLVHAKPEGFYLLFSPLIGLDFTNIWYTSSPKQYDLDRKFLKYFDYIPEAQTVIAISAISEDISDIKTIPLKENFIKYLQAKYSIKTAPVNQIERYIADNIDKILSSLQLSKSFIKEDDKTVILYQLPEIDDLYYGHSFTQELIVECLIAIEQDIQKSDMKSQPIIINCERGTNRSKAIYEAIVGLRYRDSSNIMLSAIQATSPENMSHFTLSGLSRYTYLGHNEDGSKISPIKNLALSMTEESETYERSQKKTRLSDQEKTFCLTL